MDPKRSKMGPWRSLRSIQIRGRAAWWVPRLPEAPPGPKMDQNGPQTGPKMTQNGPESAKMDRNGSQDAPNCTPNGPETPPWTRSATCTGTDRSGRERAQPPSDRGQWGRPVTRASVLNLRTCWGQINADGSDDDVASSRRCGGTIRRNDTRLEIRKLFIQCGIIATHR